MPRPKQPASPFRYFNSSPEIIRLVVMMYVRFPLSLRNVEDLLAERGIDICHETVRYWWNRFGPLFAADVRRQRVNRMRGFRQWKWHLDEVYVKINGEMHYLWRAVDQEGEVLESFVTKTSDKAAALTLHEEGAQAPRQPRNDHHRWSALLQGGDDRARQCREAGGRPLGQQPGREQPPAVPTTRAGDAAVPADEDLYRSSPRSTPTSTTTSTWNATSSTDRPTRNAARPHWPSGSRSWGRRALKDRACPYETLSICSDTSLC